MTIELSDFEIRKKKKKKHGRKHIHTNRLIDPLIEDHVKRNKKGKHKQKSKKKVLRDRIRIKKKRKVVVEDTIQATKTGAQINEYQLIASICRDSFYDFVKEFWDVLIPEKPVWNWHIQYLCQELQKMAERVFRGEDKLHDLVVNIPPGTTKSTIMSVMFPAWLWTRMPSIRFIGASHAEKLALDLSMKCRDIIKSDLYRACFPEVVLRDDQDTKTKFQNTKGGYRYAIGVDGAVIGMHAHIIVIDDPIDVNSATSATLLRKTNYWIDSQLSNRKVDKGISFMVLVMQRLHQDDPTSLFLRRKKIKHICLPAERSDKISPPELYKYYNKKGGGLLDAVRLSRAVLEEEKQKGQYYYSSQFAQDPIPLGGGMFKVKRIKRDILPDKFKRIARYWDKAGTQMGGTYTVGTKMGLDFEGRFWVIDVRRVQLDSYEREKLISKLAHADGYDCRIGVEQEPGSGGKESAEATAKSLAGYKVEIHRANPQEGGKIERADPFSVQVNAGNVYIPTYMWDEKKQEWKDWAKEWIEEYQFFPNSKYKDQVDSGSGAFKMCHKPVKRVGGMSRKQGYSRKKFLEQVSSN